MDLGSHYWLINAHIPKCLLGKNFGDRNIEQKVTKEGLIACDLEILADKIVSIYPTESRPPIDESVPVWDLKRGIVLPCFVDMHTHLDKGHIWERSPNPDGTFKSALTAVGGDRHANSESDYLDFEDIYLRMEFGLKCSYAQGTKAIRTHLDCPPPQFELSLQVFKELQTEWRDRLILQATSLVTLDEYAGKNGEVLANRIAEIGGVLGGVAYTNPNLQTELDRLFELAIERQLDLDLHTDENDDPTSQTLKAVAQTALRYNFKGNIICGHCCSLAVQSENDIKETFQVVKAAQIGIVSLPMCNLYLQDRHPSRTPRWRGVTLIQELKQNGISIAIASDNVRDPFFGFGNHDGLEVFAMAVRIAHLDTPYGDWIEAITTTPAELIGLNPNYIDIGSTADLIVFKARYFSELLSRPQSDRHVIRNGTPIDTTLPDYEELD